MATNILGLFTSPEQYQANQMAQFRQQAANEVQLDPFQQASIGMRQAGYQLGGGIGGALGGQDPQLQKIAKRQALIGMLKQNDPASYATVADLATRNGDPEFGILLSQEGRKVEESIAGTTLKNAQAQKAQNQQQAQTDSAQKRTIISSLEQKLATDPTYKPTQQEIASARFIVATETKPKSFIDPQTNQLIVIDGLDINAAAPNLANYLKQTSVGSTASGAEPSSTGIKTIETPGSVIKAKEEADKQAAKLEEDTRAAESMSNALANIKAVKSLITDTKNLIKPTTTGLTGKVLALGSTEARVLDNNNQRIKANTVFEELLNLKSQSKTGATGFGALNLEELKTIQNKAATLDPVSPNYAKELADIDAYFSRIEKMTSNRNVRAEEKIKSRQTPTSSAKPSPSNDEAKIKRFIDFNGGKPTREQAINALKASGLIK
jgi:hypothetical protein